ncbi:MAG: hypothetical protein PUC88_03950 [Clostridia bacterium]|nr:hypothetical protein [Clostridia bacterium]
MLKRITAIIFSIAFIINLNLTASALPEAHLKTEGNTIIFSFGGCDADIVRFVLHYDNTKAEINSIKTTDNARLRYNDKDSATTILYYKNNGVSDGNKSEINIKFKKNFHGKFYVTNSEMIDSKGNHSDMICDDVIEVSQAGGKVNITTSKSVKSSNSDSKNKSGNSSKPTVPSVDTPDQNQIDELDEPDIIMLDGNDNSIKMLFIGFAVGLFFVISMVIVYRIGKNSSKKDKEEKNSENSYLKDD